MQIETVTHVLGSLDRKTTVCMHRALGSAGCARSVNEHQVVFSARWLRSRFVTLAGHQIVPPMISSWIPRCLEAGPPKNDHMPECRDLCRGFVGDRFHWTHFSATKAAVRREQGFGVRVR